MSKSFRLSQPIPFKAFGLDSDKLATCVRVDEGELVTRMWIVEWLRERPVGDDVLQARARDSFYSGLRYVGPFPNGMVYVAAEKPC